MDIQKLVLLAALFTAACDGGDGDGDGGDGTDAPEGGISVEGAVGTLFGNIYASDTVQDDGGLISGNTLTLTSDIEWRLEGGVFIGDDENDFTLEIEPGTTIYGDSATDGFLVIQRGAKIDAQGTANDPIVFTSAQAEGSRGRGDWGGLIINGRSTTNVCDDTADCNIPGEAGSGEYGGGDEADNSGILEYVRVEFAGTLVNETNELNGIAFQGVGSGTQVSYIEVLQNADDCVEFFGGTVEADHVVAIGCGDDHVDWTDGWRGALDHVVIALWGDSGDNGIEADNNGDANDALPRSAPEIANITIVGGQGASGPADTTDAGMLLREGTGATISKALVLGFGEGCVDLDHDATFMNAWDASTQMLTGGLTIEDSMFWCPDGAAGVDEIPEFPSDEDDAATDPDGDAGTDDGYPTVEDFVLVHNTNNVVSDPMLEDPYTESAPNFAPAAGSPALTHAGGSYIGAFDGTTNWLDGWTSFSAN